MFKMNFRQKLIFYVHPGTVPTQRAAPKRNLFFQIGRNLQKKTTVPLHSVFSPHHVASGDVNLNNMDHMPNILFSAFSVFHHPVRSVKAKHSYIPPKFDNAVPYPMHPRIVQFVPRLRRTGTQLEQQRHPSQCYSREVTPTNGRENN
jgi:hypothetical protein